MNKGVVFVFLLWASAFPVHAQIQITEIMYDPSGTDTGREWVEVQNVGGNTIDFTTWKFFEANVNHGIDQIEGYAKELQTNEFGVVVSDKAKFLADFPTFSGKIFKSSFSLNNSGENLAFKAESSGPIIDQYLYDITLGAAGDGNSLQKGTTWLAALPTPGTATVSGSGSTGGGSNGSTGTTTTTTTATTTTTGGGGGTSGTTTSTLIIPASTPLITGSGGGYVVPQLFGAVIVPSVAIAGVETTLQAQAFVSGGKSVSNPRFAWNFGDGTIGQGASTTHRYKYPGNYHIALDVTAVMNNNDTSVLEHASLSVIAPNVSIVEGKDEEGGTYIAISNETKYILDVSSWVIKRGNDGGEKYVLPKNTFIAPYITLRISQEATQFKTDNVLKMVELLFPNMTRVAMYDPIEAATQEVSSATSTHLETHSPLSIPSFQEASAIVAKKIPIVVPQKKEVTQPISQQIAHTTSSPATSSNVLVAAVATKQQETSLMWYILSLLVLVITVALFLGRKKENDPLDSYTIIDDGK